MPEKLRSTSAPPKKNDWDVDKNHFKRRNWVLDEMIWAFNEIKLDRDPQFWIKKGARDEEKFKAYYDRRKNGLRLFGKYYENLWD